MKDKLLTYTFIILMVFALFAFAWPIMRDVVVDQVKKLDGIDQNISIPNDPQ